MLIRRAELEDGRIADVRIAGETIAAIGDFAPQPGEPRLDADGGLLLPGLHDHHIHLAALAAAQASVRCGPPVVSDAAALAAALAAAGGSGSGWLRGIGYHESVAGLPDAAMLDRMLPDRPLRIQHRSGRMWFFNSAGLALILRHGVPAGLEREGGRWTGRLFDADDWLRAALGSGPPAFARTAALLARCGVTGLTDMSPANDPAVARHFAAEMATGDLPQRVHLAGSLALRDADMAGRLSRGPAKLHLHEADLPPLDTAARFVARAHEDGRAVAVHCATEVELIFTLAAFDEAGTIPGDRIEHASVTPDFAIGRIAELGLAVCSQPHFIAERGDAYARDVAADARPLLYRLQAFRNAGVPLAGGSDAPFGGPDPWAAMAAAVSRRTTDGAIIGGEEALTPEQALDLFLRAPNDLARRRRVVEGGPADLCLLDRPWAAVRGALASERVRAVFVGGRRIDDRIDQPPA